MASDLLERMRRNPAVDWSIEDAEAIRREHGLIFAPAKGRLTAMPSIRRRGNLDHTGAPPNHAGLHSQACALYRATMELKYAVRVERLAESDGGGHLATAPDLPGCMSDSATPE
jgi:hypothetical protein